MSASEIIAITIAIISLVFSAITLVMNKLATFRRYKIRHSTLWYFGMPGVKESDQFIGIEVLNTGYHPVTITEFGFFKKNKERCVVPNPGIVGVKLPCKIEPGESATFPIKIKVAGDLSDIEYVHVRDMTNRYKKQKFQKSKFEKVKNES